MDARVAAAQAVSASKQQVDEFFHWLVGEMKRNLERKPMPKDEFKRKAKAQFGVGDRKFEECWAGAIAETGATSWSRSGAPRGPRKSPRKSSHDK
jgi:hypothetical protein